MYTDHIESPLLCTPTSTSLKCTLSQAKSLQRARLSIGEVARETAAGFALRFYEKSGLLRLPAQVEAHDAMTRPVLGRIYIIKLAFEPVLRSPRRDVLVRFSKETHRQALRRCRRQTGRGEALMERAQKIEATSETSFHCGCPAPGGCERIASGAKSRQERMPRRS